MDALSESDGVGAALQRICEDGEPVRCMLLLADMTILADRAGILSLADKQHLCDIQHLLGEIALRKEMT